MTEAIPAVYSPSNRGANCNTTQCGPAPKARSDGILIYPCIDVSLTGALACRLVSVEGGMGR